MEKPIIEVKGLSKKYNIAHQRGGYVALRDIIGNIIRKPFSFLKYKIKSTLGSARKEEFWALKDVSFTVQKGEVVGVIGANGAGKSTFLKILSQITPPTDGEVILRGRIGSLLEVGTGFHPELTGRENIFLNGAILGMKKREIEEKFDEIVTFAGIERFLDTPVKHYSSGMYVRLAFSVAAHMESDILLVDEVLAVGDAEFQKKCLGKMDEITKKDGRTILFVSHSMAAVQALCTRTILLKNGKITASGETKKVIEAYHETISSIVGNLSSVSLKDRRKRTNGSVIFEEVKGVKNNSECWNFRSDEEVCFHFKCKANETVDNLLFYMAFLDPLTSKIITNLRTTIKKTAAEKGEFFVFDITIPAGVLRPGQFLLYFTLSNVERSVWYDVVDKNVNMPTLTVLPVNADPNDNSGVISIPFKIHIENKDNA